MKQMKLPIIIVVLLLIAVGAYFVINRGSVSVDPQALVTDAISGQGSMRCEYTDEEGRVVTAYLKNGNMRTDMTGGEEGAMSMIYKDKTTWTWDQTTKEGMMFTTPEVTPGTTDSQETEYDASSENSEEMKAEIEKYKDSCKQSVIDDSLFVAPTDVTFQDYSTMMQQQMDQIPAEYQQMMQQGQ